MIGILLGVLGLSAVIVIHELGHFFAARAMGVEVEAFSVGWGPRLFGFTRKGVEWRVSAFPLGGYCRLKGEESFRAALERKMETIPAEPGSFYGAHPLRRILIGASGPLANLAFAFVLFIVTSAVGTAIYSSPNRIILASDRPSLSGARNPADPNPADQAGLKTGDYILAIDGRPMADYAALQEAIGVSPGQTLRMEVLRDGQRIAASVTPRMDPASGTGLIGVYSWTDPVVATVSPGSAASIAGLEPGDRILAADGTPIAATIDLYAAMAGQPERLTLEVERNGQRLSHDVVLSWKDSGDSDLGIGFALQRRMIRAESPAAAVSMGFSETAKTLGLSFKSIKLLFSGVNVMKAVSGPARITWMVGKTATEGIKSDGAAGLAQLLGFLAFLSVSLFVMNLLPIPVLDGGQILLFIVEILKRAPLKVKTIARFQYVGAGMIMVLMLMATFSDLLFFSGR